MTLALRDGVYGFCVDLMDYRDGWFRRMRALYIPSMDDE